MAVQIDQSFPKAVTKLSASEAKRVWAFLDKFLGDPAHPSLKLERVTKTKNQNLWSARISQELRAIIYKDGENWQVLHADHHDAAYHWAATKQISKHSRTGALQVVEPPEIVEKQIQDFEVIHTQLPDIFSEHQDDYLVSLGVPENWLPTLRKIKTETLLLEAIFDLPDDVGARLVDLAAGELVTPPIPLLPGQSVNEVPAAQRRFFVLEQSNDLLRMLEAPLATWVAFLHPSQQKLAIGNFNGPLKITGSAGTGKTVVALHRARHLARQGKRVLLTSYVTTLCDNIEQNLKLLCTPQELSRITVSTIHRQALTLANAVEGGKRIMPVEKDEISQFIHQAYVPTCPLDESLLLAEWDSVIQDQGITSWDEYRKVSRVGRGTPLSVKARKQVWQVFAQVIEDLKRIRKTDWPGICKLAGELLQSGEVSSSFDAVIVDELQDLRPQAIQLLPLLAGTGKNSLTVVGDGGQRIYNGRFSLKSLGIDVRGRSHILKINYRTTEQIRRFADHLLHHQSDDMDGGQESRKGTVSLLKGPEPCTRAFLTRKQEQVFILEKIRQLHQEGLAFEEIAVFSRTHKRLKFLESALQEAHILCHSLQTGGVTEGAVNLGTMHRAKGLEFKAVFVAHVSDDQMPLASVIAKVQDSQLRQDWLERERQLLYVSLTRARDEVYVTWTGEPSRFLEEVLTAPQLESAKEPTVIVQEGNS